MTKIFRRPRWLAIVPEIIFPMILGFVVFPLAIYLFFQLPAGAMALVVIGVLGFIFERKARR